MDVDGRQSGWLHRAYHASKLVPEQRPVRRLWLVVLGLSQLLRPALALRAAHTDHDRLHSELASWGRNPISHLALYGDTAYHWSKSGGCVPFRLMGRVALVLGDPIAPPSEFKAKIVTNWIGGTQN